jgi:hypothetical protein
MRKEILPIASQKSGNGKSFDFRRVTPALQGASGVLPRPLREGRTMRCDSHQDDTASTPVEMRCGNVFPRTSGAAPSAAGNPKTVRE